MSVSRPDLKCRHCAKNGQTRPRGLCYPCFNDPSVRLLYPTLSKYGQRGMSGENVARRPLPTRPTSALPGTQKKVQVMERRAALGRAIHHPRDRQADTS